MSSRRKNAVSTIVTILMIVILVLVAMIASVFLLSNYLPPSSTQTHTTESPSSSSSSTFTSISTTSTSTDPQNIVASSFTTSSLASSSLTMTLSSSSTSTSSESTSSTQISSTTSSQSSQIFSGYVNQTLFLNNGTIVSGNVISDVGVANSAVNFEGLAVDTLNGHIAVVGDSLWIIDGTTGLPIRQVAAGGFGVAFDPENGNFYVAGGNALGATVTIVNGSTSTIIGTISIPGSKYSFEAHIVFNPSNGYLYAVGYSSNVTVINGATNSFVTNIPIGGSSYGIAVDTQSGNVYVSESNPDSVAVINGTSNTLVDTIALSVQPLAISYDSSSDYIYVGTSNNVSLINTHSNTVTSEISLGVKYGSTFGLAVDPASGNIYDTGSIGNGIQVISDRTNSVTGAITINYSAGALTFDPLNGYFYVAGESSGILTAVDGTSNQVVKYIFVVQNPADVVYDGANGNLYVSESGSGMVTIISSSTLKILNEVHVGGLVNYMTFDPGNDNIYLAEQNGSIMVFNTASGTIAGRIDVGGFPNGLALDSVDSHLYVASGFDCGVGVCFGPQTVAVVDTNTNKVLTNISITDGFPTSVAYDQSNGNVYVADNGFCHGPDNCAGGHYVSIINARTDSIVGNIHVDGFPSLLLVDPVDGHLYVTYSNLGNMTIIDTTRNTVISTITLVPNTPYLFPAINRLMFDPSRGLIYATVSTDYISTNVFNMSSDLFVLSGSTDSIMSKINLGLNAFGITLSSSSNYIYVTNQESGTISVVSTAVT